jgi:hypothetical protein
MEGLQLTTAEGPPLTAVSTPYTVTGVGLVLMMLMLPVTTPWKLASSPALVAAKVQAASCTGVSSTHAVQPQTPCRQQLSHENCCMQTPTPAAEQAEH